MYRSKPLTGIPSVSLSPTVVQHGCLSPLARQPSTKSALSLACYSFPNALTEPAGVPLTPDSYWIRPQTGGFMEKTLALHTEELLCELVALAGAALLPACTPTPTLRRPQGNPVRA